MMKCEMCLLTDLRMLYQPLHSLDALGAAGSRAKNALDITRQGLVTGFASTRLSGSSAVRRRQARLASIAPR